MSFSDWLKYLLDLGGPAMNSGAFLFYRLGFGVSVCF